MMVCSLREEAKCDNRGEILWQENILYLRRCKITENWKNHGQNGI